MWIALAIVVSMILYLVDRNQQWAAFWKVTSRLSIALILFVLLGGGYMWFAQNARAQVKLPAGYEDAKPVR